MLQEEPSATLKVQKTALAAQFWGMHLVQVLSGHLVACFASLIFSQCLSHGRGWGRVPQHRVE